VAESPSAIKLRAAEDAPVEDLIAEGDRHPVFELLITSV
jgi:hypothetical protein